MVGLDYSPLELAVGQLRRSLDYLNSDMARDDAGLREQFRAATIKAFELTYELSFKMLKRHMALASISPEEIEYMTFNRLVREAFGQNLIRSDLVVWKKYRAIRGETDHAYSEDKAIEAVEAAQDFLDESRYLLEQLLARDKSLD